MAEDNNYDETDGILSRRGLMGATLAATGGLGLLSMTGSAAAQQNNIYLRDAYIGDSANRTDQLGGRGWLYFETDTGSIYYDAGSGWTDLGVSSESGGTSTDVTVIDDTQSLSTNGSSVVYVDTSSSGTNGAVTVTIDPANEQNGAPLEVYDVGEAAGQHSITIENSSGEDVTTLDVDRAYTELIYQDTRWLIKTSDSEGVWTTESNSAIPDSGLLHAYRVDDGASTSLIDDLEEGPDLTGSISSIVTDDIDGKDAARFVPSNGDLMNADLGTNVKQPYDYYFVGKMRSNGGRRYIADASDESRNVALTESTNEEWELIVNDSSYPSGVSTDTDYHLFHIEVRDNSFNLRLDDSSILSKTDTIRDFDGITFGGRANSSSEAPLNLAESLWYDAGDSGYSRLDVVSYFRDEYPSLSI